MPRKSSPTIATLAGRIADAHGSRLSAEAIAHLAVLEGTHGQKSDWKACSGAIFSFLSHCSPGLASEEQIRLRVGSKAW